MRHWPVPTHRGTAAGQSKMLFKGGTHCSGAGAREAEVHLACRLETAVLTVEETATCRYRLVLGTPAACEQRVATELEREVRAWLNLEPLISLAVGGRARRFRQR